MLQSVFYPFFIKKNLCSIMFQGRKKYTAQPELFPALFFSVIVLVRFQSPILKPSETLPSTLRAKN